MVRPFAKSILDECLDAWDAHMEVLSEPRRWTPSDIPKHLPSDYELAKRIAKLLPRKLQSSEYVWASCYNMRWTKALESLGIEQSALGLDSRVHCVVFGLRDITNRRARATTPKSDFRFYMVVEMLGS